MISKNPKYLSYQDNITETEKMQRTDNVIENGIRNNEQTSGSELSCNACGRIITIGAPSQLDNAWLFDNGVYLCSSCIPEL